MTIHYDTNHDVRVTALISNGLGYIYRHFDHSCLAGTDQLSLNCAELSKGQYIIYINVGGNFVSWNILEAFSLSVFQKTLYMISSLYTKKRYIL